MSNLSEIQWASSEQNYYTISPESIGNSLIWSKIQNKHDKTQENEFPTEALPPILRGAVDAICNSVDVHPVLAFSSVVGSLSAASGGLYDVFIKHDFCSPISLYVLVVALSGEGKSPSDAAASQAILYWQNEKDEEFKKNLRIHEARMRQDKDYDEPPPIHQSLIQQSITKERMIQRLEQYPEMFISSNEAGLIVGQNSMKSENSMGFLSILNTAWSGGRVSNNTKGSEYQFCGNPRISLYLAMQPKVFESLLGSNDGEATDLGFLPRCLVAYPPSRIGYRTFKDTGFNRARELKQFDILIYQLLTKSRHYENGSFQPTRVYFEDEAREEWIAIHNAIEADMQPGGDLFNVREWSCKFSNNLARLACLFEIALTTDIYQEFKISEPALVMAEMVMNYFKREQLRLIEPEEEKQSNEILEWLINKCQDQPYIRLAAFEQSCPYKFRGKKNYELRGKILEDLIEQHCIQKMKVVDTFYLFVNPALLEQS